MSNGLKIAYLVGIIVLLFIILVAIAIAVILSTNSKSPWFHQIDEPVFTSEFLRGQAVIGSSSHPQMLQDASPKYVVAEMHQNIPDGEVAEVVDANGKYIGPWHYDEETKSCNIGEDENGVILASEVGRIVYEPTPTMGPTHTPMPTDAPPHPEEYKLECEDITVSDGVGLSCVALPTPRAQWPTSTPRPTYTPYPTPTLAPPIKSTHWDGFGDSVLHVETDGLITINAESNTEVSAFLDFHAGIEHESAGQSVFRLAALPVPNIQQDRETVYIDLKQATNYIRLDEHYNQVITEDIPLDPADLLINPFAQPVTVRFATPYLVTPHRVVHLRLNISPVERDDHCTSAFIDLKFKRSMSMVVSALTDTTPFRAGLRIPVVPEGYYPYYAAVGHDEATAIVNLGKDDKRVGSHTGIIFIPEDMMDMATPHIVFAVLTTAGPLKRITPPDILVDTIGALRDDLYGFSLYSRTDIFYTSYNIYTRGTHVDPIRLGHEWRLE